MADKVRHYILLSRPDQYIKNFFIFLPLFFDGRITDSYLLWRCFLAFIAFCLAASSIYIFNDYFDAEEDRRHPKKKNRPIASGTVAGREALALSVVLLAGGLSLSLYLGFNALYLLLGYSALNIAYTLKIKHISIVDVFAIALCFLIRLFVGSAVTGIKLSMWIIIMTFLLALFLALAKRKDDLRIFLTGGEKTRKVVDGYNMEILNYSMIIMAAVIIVSYIMYSISPDVISRVKTDKMYITVVFVILGIMRYMQISFVEENSGSPTEVLVKDRFLQLSILGWVISSGIILYR